jgi:hypothetical protein
MQSYAESDIIRLAGQLRLLNCGINAMRLQHLQLANFMVALSQDSNLLTFKVCTNLIGGSMVLDSLTNRMHVQSALHAGRYTDNILTVENLRNSWFWFK